MRRRVADVHLRLGHRRHRERVRESVLGALELPHVSVRISSVTPLALPIVAAIGQLAAARMYPITTLE
jgi:hypothetical protein